MAGSQPLTKIVFDDASSPSVQVAPSPMSAIMRSRAELRACSACLRAASAAACPGSAMAPNADRRDDVIDAAASRRSMRSGRCWVYACD